MASSKKREMTPAQKEALAKARAALAAGKKNSSSAPETESQQVVALVEEVRELKKLFADFTAQSESRFNAVMKQLDEVRTICLESREKKITTPDFLKKF